MFAMWSTCTQEEKVRIKSTIAKASEHLPTSGHTSRTKEQKAEARRNISFPAAQIHGEGHWLTPTAKVNKNIESVNAITVGLVIPYLTPTSGKPGAIIELANGEQNVYSDTCPSPGRQSSEGT